MASRHESTFGRRWVRFVASGALGAAALAAGAAASAQPTPPAPTGRHRVGQQLSCTSTETDCLVRNMPLIAQCGSAADPVDADVAFACGAACATTSHTMVLSAAYANRTSTRAYPVASRSGQFFALPAKNARGRNSFMMRENAKNNRSYYPANGLPTPAETYPAYSMQNAIYDLAPQPWIFLRSLNESTKLSPLGCDVDAWWTCETTNNFGKTRFDFDVAGKTTFDNAHFKQKQDADWVTMISFFHETLEVHHSGIVSYYEYKLVNPHKVAVNGYVYDAAPEDGWIRINDPGAGAKRKAKVKTLYSGVHDTVVNAPTPMVVHRTVTTLPNNATAWPYLKYSDEAELKLFEGVDYVNMN